MVKEPICTNVRAALYQKYSQGANDLGPSLVPPSGMGKQPLSVKPSAAKAVFGTSKRDALTLQPGRDSPAPNAYGTPSMMGKLGASTGSKYRRSAAQVKFGTATRDAGTVKSITAGPGPVPVDYLRARPQTADSTRRNAPKFSIPKNTVKPKATTTYVSVALRCVSRCRVVSPPVCFVFCGCVFLHLSVSLYLSVSVHVCVCVCVILAGPRPPPTRTGRRAPSAGKPCPATPARRWLGLGRRHATKNPPEPTPRARPPTLRLLLNALPPPTPGCGTRRGLGLARRSPKPPAKPGRRDPRCAFFFFLL